MMTEVAKHFSAASFLIEFDPPLIVPKMELVNNGNDNSGKGSELPSPPKS